MRIASIAALVLICGTAAAQPKPNPHEAAADAKLKVICAEAESKVNELRKLYPELQMSINCGRYETLSGGEEQTFTYPLTRDEAEQLDRIRASNNIRFREEVALENKILRRTVIRHWTTETPAGTSSASSWTLT